MKITLVEPRAPDYHVFSMVRLPRLGLVGLATVLRSQGYDCRVWCQSIQEVPAFELLSSDLVGISVTTSTAPEAYRLGRLLRHRGVSVVLGGPHVTFLPEEGLAAADFVLRGEADDTFPALVRCLAEGADFRETPGLSYHWNGGMVHNPLPPPVDLERLPRPDLGVLANSGRLKLHPVMTSRGCPHACTFCAVTALFGRRCRFRSVTQVVEEVEVFRGRRVFFYDDNFTASPARTKEILRLMIARRAVPRAWMAQIRVEATRDKELLQLMSRTNCRMAQVGFESVNPRTLQEFQKGQGVADIRACIKALHRHGIGVHGMFVLGSDEDTEQTAGETVAFAREEGIDTAQFLVLTPIPGTQLFADLERQGRLLTRDWSLYDGHHVVYQPARMTPEALQNGVMRAFSQFYGLGPILQDLVTLRVATAGYKLVGRHILGRWLAHHPDLAQAIGSRKSRRFHLEGFLDRSTFRQLVHDLKASLARGQHRLDIHLANLQLPSERTFRRLVRFLDRVAARPGISIRLIGVSSRLEAMIAAGLSNLPRFDCVWPDEAT
ncbi:MAG: radical SAM protein [bacterium]|nr:radical SAM protein [bacterium]